MKKILKGLFLLPVFLQSLSAENVLIDDLVDVILETSQTKKIIGEVLDATGTPVIGANIKVKGTANGTVTDMYGKFSLEVNMDATILVSYIGFVSQEIKVGTQTNFSIKLREDAEALEEVVVVGYGTQTRSSLSSSIVEIKGDKLTNLPIANISRAIDSYVPGVTASATLSEKPGSACLLYTSPSPRDA